MVKGKKYKIKCELVIDYWSGLKSDTETTSQLYNQLRKSISGDKIKIKFYSRELGKNLESFIPISEISNTNIIEDLDDEDYN